MCAALMDMSQTLDANLAYAPLDAYEVSGDVVAATLNASAITIGISGQTSNGSQYDGTQSGHNGSIADDAIGHYVPVDQRPETFIVCVIFALIFIVGVLGNGTLVIIFFRHRSMRNIPNTYILSLALADLLVILVCVPVASVVYTQESWTFGRNVCRISESFKDISIGVSVFTLTALSGERYCAIVNPLRKLQTKPLTVFTAVMIWVFAILLAMPSFVVSDLQEYPLLDNASLTIKVCSPFGRNRTNLEIYSKYMVVAKASIYYLLPLSIIGALYIMMAQRLHISARDMPGEQLSVQSRTQARARRHVARMVVAFVVVFFACFFPYHLFELWFHLNPTAKDDFDHVWHIIRIVGFCTSFLNSCVNPVALYCVSGVFRQHFNRYLCCICVKRQPHMRQHSTATGIMDTSVMSMRRSTYVGGVGGGNISGVNRASLHMNNIQGSSVGGGRGSSFHRQGSMPLQHSARNISNNNTNGNANNMPMGAAIGGGATAAGASGRAAILSEKR
ncbi:neuropeptide CCHamide-2 receptor [Scaptodrosophila lebanonensis]|uniref:Neuropeptide CCHamide-2 receptor n=1 Tax=Drosophila lebanonensis TaxID=7225 RepID=A0A6J2THM8_DROLE|nr:neuropeptide CCHamide-2 receptor [Scaptodrosophila lebanonensis]